MTLPAHKHTEYRAKDLAQGFHGDHIDFDYRPFEKRKAEARADYLELKADLAKNGMRHPLITHKGHVLIGMRRFEIMCEFGQETFPCIEITEDVSKWWHDADEKIKALKERYYGS